VERQGTRKGVVRHGMFLSGLVRFGVAWIKERCGAVRNGREGSVVSGAARIGMARKGKEPGMVGLGMVRQGTALCGEEGNGLARWCEARIMARQGVAYHGKAGEARQGKDQGKINQSLASEDH